MFNFLTQQPAVTYHFLPEILAFIYLHQNQHVLHIYNFVTAVSQNQLRNSQYSDFSCSFRKKDYK